MTELSAPALDPLPLDPVEAAGAAPDELRAIHEKAAQSLARAFWEGAPVPELVQARAWAVDRLLQRLWELELGDGHGAALVAVGGYGRGELHPHSDVDVTVLLPGPAAPELARALERFVAAAWDTGLELGHSVRTIAECAGAAGEDVTVATNLMEARLLAGPERLHTELTETVSPRRIWPAPEFFRAKWAEQQDRHARFHDTAYNLEPNVKEGPGGLRDIQMVAWVARRHLGSTALHDLVNAGFLDEAEYEELLAGRDYLWGIRYALHLVAGRREDRLLFDHQRELARRFGYRDEHRQNLAVEQFMRRYYRTVMKLEVLNDLLLRHYQESLTPPGGQPRPIDDRFRSRGGLLEAADPGVFHRDPAALLEAFLIMARHPDLDGISAATLRQIRAQRDRVTGLDREARPRELFMAILREPSGVYRALQLMNRYGILGRYLPVFGRIVGHMQYDLFHVYTVDQHTLFVVRNLRRFANRAAAETFPHAQPILGRIKRVELLYLAGLFHDIAKGRGGDHSELGAADAEAFCLAHGLDTADTRLVAWLVRNHLLMSVTAQKQDIGDPEVINTFARTVRDRRHLDHLYLLTMADIAATNPKLWSSWKDRLLHELYTSARYALRRGLENPIENDEWIRQTREAARAELLDNGFVETNIEASWAVLPEDYFHRLGAEQVAWQTRVLLEAGAHQPPLVNARPAPGGGSTELLVYTPDRDRLFATIAAALDRLALNVVEARIFTTSDGYALDSFRLLGADGGALEPIREREAERALSRELKRSDGGVPRVTRNLPRRLRHFTVPTRVEFDNEPRTGRTQLAIVTSDRPGLLSLIGRALAACEARVHSARIATFGERVEDFFSITDSLGAPLGDGQRDRLHRELLERLDNVAADHRETRETTS